MDYSQIKKYQISRTAFFLILCLLFISCSRKEEKNYADISKELATSDNARDSLVIELEGTDSMSVFDLLLNEHDVKFKSSLQGVFVAAIDSVKTGDGYYWIYTVNDSAAQTACDKYITRNGDRIKWLFRKS